eukprot:c17292_g1_i1 orf=226-1098(-)
MTFRFHDQGERYNEGFIITRSLEQDENQKEVVDIDGVLETCTKELYRPKYLAKGYYSEIEVEECPICLERFKELEQLLKLPCNHRFHVDCIVPWIKNNHDKCPFCRAKIMVKRNLNMVGPLNVANNVPLNQMYSNPHTSTRDLYDTSRNIPFHNQSHANRDIPLRMNSMPHQTNNAHSVRFDPRIPHSSSSMSNVPSAINYGQPVRDIPISRQRPPNYYGQAIREPITHQRPPNYSHHTIPIAHQRPPNYAHDFFSGGGYTRRHINGVLADFGDEETTLATTISRLSFWI